MSETIASLIEPLDAAWASLQEATSQRQRKARNQRVINAGVALYERLEALGAWLNANWEAGQDGDAVYLANMQKYEQGWAALNRVGTSLDTWKRLHYEEVSDARSGTGRPAGRASSAQGRAQRARQNEARADAVALAKGIIADHRGAVAGGVESSPQQPVLTGLG